MKPPLLLKLCWVVALLLIGAAAASANSYVVNSTGDDGWDGNPHHLCETGFLNGVCTLRAAIELSNAVGGGTISFNIPTSDPGYRNGVWTIYLGQALPDISSPVSISGPGAPSLVVSGFIGPSRVRVFNVTTTGTVNFSGLTIVNAGAPSNENGGGIQNVNAGTVTVTNCTLTGNVSGGVDATGGGGIANSSNGTVNVTNCIFSFNLAAGGAGGRAYLGGAIYNNTGALNVSNSTFAHNAADRGGGIFNDNGGTVAVTNCTFSGNGATIDGGGISSATGSANVTSSTFYANVAFGTANGDFPAGVGGGVSKLFSKGVLNLTNSTIAANFAQGTGGGLFADSNSVVNVKSCIIASNYGGMFINTGPAPDVSGAFTSHGFNLIGAKDGSTGFTAATDKKGTIASPLNPKLDPKGLRNNGGPTQTIALMTSSPAIDKGTSVGLTGTLTTDQRGFPRKIDKAVGNATGGDGTDIGAFEVQ